MSKRIGEFAEHHDSTNAEQENPKFLIARERVAKKSSH